MRAVALSAAVAVSACSIGGPSNPGQDQLLAALRAHFNNAAIVEIQLAGACEPGRVGEREVQVCGYCVVWVGNEAEPGGLPPYDAPVLTRVYASRGHYHAAFAQAVSFEQPTVQPQGGSGVWIVATPPTLDRGTSQSMVDLTDGQIAATGMEVRRVPSPYGFGPQRIRAFFEGRSLDVNSVITRFELPASAAAVFDAVGACDGTSPPSLAVGVRPRPADPARANGKGTEIIASDRSSPAPYQREVRRSTFSPFVLSDLDLAPGYYRVEVAPVTAMVEGSNTSLDSNVLLGPGQVRSGGRVHIGGDRSIGIRFAVTEAEAARLRYPETSLLFIFRPE